MDDNYDTMSLKDLKQYCRDKKYKGHSKCRTKNDLKEFIKKNIELESKDKEQNIICGKCSERGHHSYKCTNDEKEKIIKKLKDEIKELKLKMCFEDPNVEECGSGNEYKDVNEYQDEDDMNTNEFTFDKKYDNTSIKIKILEMEDRKNKSNIEELQNKCDTLIHQKNTIKIKLDKYQSHRDKCDNDREQKFKELFDPVMTDIKKKYGRTIFSKNVNEYHIDRYNLFIDKHNGLDKQIILFHGTSEKNIKPIMENGFSLTTHKENGAVYGEGIYFTPDINFAMKYSKEGNKKNILVCQVYVNNKIEGIKSITTFPKIPNTDKYYDTGVDYINNPKIYIKKSVEDINIIGHIQVDILSIKEISSNDHFKTGINIINNSPHKIYTYWNPNKHQSIVNLDINKCKLMGYANSKNEIKISTYLGETFILGYFDERKYFNIYKIITVTKMREQFDVK